MNLNDLELEQHIRQVNKQIPLVNLYMRDGHEGQMFLQLKEMGKAIDEAMKRLNELRFKEKVSA